MPKPETQHPESIDVDHVQITIPPGDEQIARAFYCGVLGLAEIEKPESLAGRHGFWLEIGNLQLHIGVEDGVDRTLTKAHIAYRVTDLVTWRETLERAGCLIIESIPIPGHDRFETRDPFGNRMEFIAMREGDW
jgi:catechol 2,3-dioxygenase-like lactoylglutathione lyase family enzyme